MVKRTRKNQNGEGFMDFINGVGNVAKKVGGFLKDTKILSTIGSMVPHPGVQAGARIAGSLGFGRKHGYKHKPGPKKGKAKKQQGKGFFNDLKKSFTLGQKIPRIPQQGKGTMTLHGVRSTNRPPLVPIVKL